MITPLESHHVEDAVALICRAFDPSYEASARFELGWSLSGDDNYYRPHSFVALIDGRLAGFIQCAANYAHPETFSIGWVAVDPALQGRGLGHQLVDYIERYIAETMLGGMTGTILIVDDTRLKRPGTNFYLRRGYVDGPLTHKGMHVMVKTVNPNPA